MRNLFFIFLFFESISLCVHANEPIQTKKNALSFFINAQNLIESNSDSALVLFQSIIAATKNDTSSLTMYSYIQAGKLQALNQNFADAFEYTGQGLRRAEELNDTLAIAKTTAELGLLYKEFGKEDQSFNLLLRSLNLYKALLAKGEVIPNNVSGAHFNMAMHYRRFSNLERALAHLDTCEIISHKRFRARIYDSYHRAEQACIYTDIGKIDTAKIILHDIESLIRPHIEDSTVTTSVKGFLSIVYLYLGNAYLREQNYTAAIAQYNQAVLINKKYRLHNSSLNEILENRATAEFKIKDFEQAFLDLRESKKLGDANFGITSLQNSSLIQIKSKYQKEIEEQRLELLEKDNILSEQKQSILLFRLLLVVLISALLIGFLVLFNRFQKNRFNREKTDIEQKRKASQEALEIKNKELTAFTLKFIEKEKVINSLAERLKEKSKDDKSTNALLKSLNTGSEALWEEFNTRFVTVNVGFYERLQKIFPELSSTERKHCALIKLNFSGKEMAHLLGITVTSVHVARYRLRKRFGLKKDENLTDYIAGI